MFQKLPDQWSPQLLFRILIKITSKGPSLCTLVQF